MAEAGSELGGDWGLLLNRTLLFHPQRLLRVAEEGHYPANVSDMLCVP